MILLASVLQGERTDPELIQIALDTLANVMTYESENPEGRTSFLRRDSFYSSFRTTKFTAGYHRAIYW